MTRKEIKDLDKIWADTVKTLQNYKCEHCGLMGGRVEAAHVVGRRHRTTRWGVWRERNVGVTQMTEEYYDLCGHCLCHRCNQQYDEHGPMELDILEETVGVGRKEDLQYLARTSIAKHQDFNEIQALLLALLPVAT